MGMMALDGSGGGRGRRRHSVARGAREARRCCVHLLRLARRAPPYAQSHSGRGMQNAKADALCSVAPVQPPRCPCRSRYRCTEGPALPAPLPPLPLVRHPDLVTTRRSQVQQRSTGNGHGGSTSEPTQQSNSSPIGHEAGVVLPPACLQGMGATPWKQQREAGQLPLLPCPHAPSANPCRKRREARRRASRGAPPPCFPVQAPVLARLSDLRKSLHARAAG